jgi:phosphoglycolate phosphatase
MSAQLRRGKLPNCGIIFDFDGTLSVMSIDFNAMRSAINTLFQSYGVSPEELDTPFILERIDEACSKIKKTDSLLAAKVREEAFVILEKMESVASLKSRLLPGVYNRLWTLKAQGAALAIATRNCKKALKQVLGKADALFDIILTRENSHAYKPDKASISPILDVFNMSPENIFMIGDHPLDIQTAQASGIIPLGVLTGTGEKNALQEAGAICIYKQVIQALDTILYMFNRRPRYAPGRAYQVIQFHPFFSHEI